MARLVQRSPYPHSPEVGDDDRPWRLVIHPRPESDLERRWVELVADELRAKYPGFLDADGNALPDIVDE